jgi:hypothetical protein
LTGDSQDTLAICLEVQQLYLYRHLKHSLKEWFKLLPTLEQAKKMEAGLTDKHYNELLLLR